MSNSWRRELKKLTLEVLNGGGGGGGASVGAPARDEKSENLKEDLVWN